MLRIRLALASVLVFGCGYRDDLLAVVETEAPSPAGSTSSEAEATDDTGTSSAPGTEDGDDTTGMLPDPQCPEAPPVSDTIVHVAPDGDDANDGSEAAPWATLEHAASAIGPGTTVLVHAGVYTVPAESARILGISNAGTADAPIVFRSEPPLAAVLDGLDNAVAHCVTINTGARHIRIEGFEIRGCGFGGVWSNADASEVEIVGNYVHHIGRYEGYSDTAAGIYCGGSTRGHTVDGNVVHSIGRLNPLTDPAAAESTCTTPEGEVECWSGGTAISLRGDDMIAVNNVIYDNPAGWPISVYQEDEWQDHTYVAGNSVWSRNDGLDGHVLLGPMVFDLVIENNVFASARTAMVRTLGCSDRVGIVIRNNVTDAEAAVTTDCPFQIEGNEVGIDPLLVDPAGGDLRPAPGSPLIDAGYAGARVHHDIEGRPRPGGAGFDVGAYELDAASCE